MPYNASRGVFSYYTGGHSRGSIASEAPQEVVAEGRYDQVAVTVKAFDNTGHADVDARIARFVTRATQEIWPQTALPVDVELHLMPANASYSFSRRIFWREGEPYYVTIFRNGYTGGDPGNTAAHELYHILAGRWLLGSKSPRAASDRWRASVLEETTAYLYGYCAELVTEETLTPFPLNAPFRFRDKDGGAEHVVQMPLNAEDALYLLGLSANLDGASLFGEVMSYSVLKAIIGEHLTVTLAMPEGVALRELCTQAAADPWYLQEWFTEQVAQAQPATASAGL
jgi:hypothetical protein